MINNNIYDVSYSFPLWISKPPWLVSPLTALRYAMYFRFCGWRIFIAWANGPESSNTLYFNEIRQVEVPVGRRAISFWSSSSERNTEGKVCYLRLFCLVPASCTQSVAGSTWWTYMYLCMTVYKANLKLIQLTLPYA